MWLLEFLGGTLSIGIYVVLTGAVLLVLGLFSRPPRPRRTSDGAAGWTSGVSRSGSNPDSAFAELLADAADAGFDAQALVEARGDSVAALSAALDSMSLEVARRFVAGDLSFTAGDDLMNSAWSYWTVAHGLKHEFPAMLSEVYFAFDDGEDPPADGSDPVREFTLPMLERLLRANDRHALSGAGSA